MSTITATPYGTPSSGSPRKIPAGWIVAGAAAVGLVATGLVVGPRVWTSTSTQSSTSTSTPVQLPASTVRGPNAVEAERHTYGAAASLGRSAYAPGGSVYDSQVPAMARAAAPYNAHLNELGALAAGAAASRASTARAGGPDALELHRRIGTSVFGASQESLENHFGTGTSRSSGTGVPKRGSR